MDADSNHEAFQSLRQQEYKRLGTPYVLQWYHNADRPPGKPFQSPVQQDTDQQVLAMADVNVKSQLSLPLSAFAVLVPKAPLPSTMLILSCIQSPQEVDLLQHTGEQGLSRAYSTCNGHVLASINALLHAGQGASKLSSACCGCCRG